MMKSFLLLILSLMTACGDDHEVKGCSEGWVEFSCKYDGRKGKNQNIRVDTPRDTTIQCKKNDMWEHQGRYSLYHDIKNTNLRVVIKQLESKDFGKYKCKFHNGDSSEKVKLKKVVMRHCQTPFTQTVYTTAKTNFTCDYSNNHSKGKHSRKKRSSEDRSRLYFFCKDTRGICEDILSTESPKRSNGSFTLTDISGGFNVSISHVSSQDEGVYWCGVEAKNGDRAARKKIHLKVQLPPSTPEPPPVPTTQSTTAPAQSHVPPSTPEPPPVPTTQSHGWLQAVKIVIICLPVLLMLRVLISVLMKKCLRP
ncbi:polymeric immunoglobulin receptor isoform X3 [Lates calcarifer]|uniref:polymeric immunoglobulin receptor isoform X3 n=1 Tax=Lates calcarifer TaxID=8187 RepID=UPI0021D7BD5A|nr:polymeric immunoglobulin receptor isoform X3 [Lates calcarifer]